MNIIDSFLNKITMYRLVLYVLVSMLLFAIITSFFGALSFSPLYLIWSIFLITFVSIITNVIFSRLFNVNSNPESTYITAFILALIISPPASFIDPNFLSLVFWASSWAVASKYIFAIRNKHIFNPAAFGVVITAIFILQPATWWIGTMVMIPITVIGGALITHKLRRFDLVLTFLATATFVIIFPALLQGVKISESLLQAFVYVPTLFFATIMLTEPMTTPPTRKLRILYGLIVGLLFLPEIHIYNFYIIPSIALLLGNIFSYIISPKIKAFLTLVEKIQLAPNVYEFVFSTNKQMRFSAGQYVELTLPHTNTDNRGIRRFFTIASEPNNKLLKLSTKFYKPSSTFKTNLFSLNKNDILYASQLSGDFIMPKNPKEKIVFIAGGIGITPFISMIRDIISKNTRVDVTLIYINRTQTNTAYIDLLKEAEVNGIKTMYIFTDTQSGHVDISQTTIIENIPDFQNSIFYISGPHAMVVSIKNILKRLKISRSKIKTDYFPGFM